LDKESMAYYGMTATEVAEEWLADKLSYGPWLVNDLYEEAEEVGIAARTLRRAKSNLGYETIEGFNRQWWWYSPSVKLSEEAKKAWFNKNDDWIKENVGNLDEFYDEDISSFHDDDKDLDTYLVSKRNKNGSIEVEPHYASSYDWLENHSIYYFDHDDDFTELPNCDQAWATKLRAKPHKFESFKHIMNLSGKKIEKFDNWKDEDKRNVWLEVKEKITKENWVEEARKLYQENYDKYYKTQIRDKNRQSILHRRKYEDHFGHKFHGQSDDDVNMNFDN